MLVIAIKKFQILSLRVWQRIVSVLSACFTLHGERKVSHLTTSYLLFCQLLNLKISVVRNGEKSWEQIEEIWQVNLLTTVLNDAPVQPEEDDEDTASLLKDSPQCVSFGLFMIWWGLQLGKTFYPGLELAVIRTINFDFWGQGQSWGLIRAILQKTAFSLARAGSH